jgi:hypothetical protein
MTLLPSQGVMNLDECRSLERLAVTTNQGNNDKGVMLMLCDGLSEQMAKLNADRTGKPLSPEHRAKISANQTGREKTPETRAAMSAAHTGKKKTPEHAANIRAAKLGKKRSPEVRAKISATKQAKKLAKQQSLQPPLF